jgi:hypothetical protein
MISSGRRPPLKSIRLSRLMPNPKRGFRPAAFVIRPAMFQGITHPPNDAEAFVARQISHYSDNSTHRFLTLQL